MNNPCFKENEESISYFLGIVKVLSFWAVESQKSLSSF